MFFKKTVWIIIFIVFHTVFFKQSAHSDNQNYPTYSKFLKNFQMGIQNLVVLEIQKVWAHSKCI